MQAFPRVSLQKSLFSRKRAANLASFLVNPPLASSECLRVATPSPRLSESCSIDTRTSTTSERAGPPTVFTSLTQFAHSTENHTLSSLATRLFGALCLSQDEVSLSF